MPNKEPAKLTRVSDQLIANIVGASLLAPQIKAQSQRRSEISIAVQRRLMSDLAYGRRRDNAARAGYSDWRKSVGR